MRQNPKEPMIILTFFVAHWYASLFFQSFLQHRYAAHQQFTMSRITERIFMVLAWLAQGSSYLSCYAYGILHRLHHAYADTENDPHSPKYDGNFWRMMWRTRQYYSDIFDGSRPVEERFRKNLPTWMAFERFAESWVTRLAWIAAYTGFYIAFATSWWMFLLLPVHYFMGPVHGAIINWFAHKFGTADFEVNDTSRNLLPVDLLMMGESYHNNHHRFPSRPNFGVRWYQIDMVYPFIRLFHWMGIIRLRPAVAG